MKIHALLSTLPAIAFLLCGCGTLPTIDPDARGLAEPVVLEGARGPLSAKQSQAILDRMESRGAETDIFERHLAHEEAIVGAPLVVGNKVVLLQDGPATYEAMFKAIRGATDHINMETYIIEDDDVGNRFVDELLARQAQGVQVNFIHDSVGTFETPPAFFKRMTDGGIRVVEFNPVNPLNVKAEWDPNQRDHRKLLIVDGATAFVGGVNISSVYSGGSGGSGGSRSSQATGPDGGLPWRDTHLQMDGPVVAEFQKLFIATWEKQKGGTLAPRKYYPPAVSRGREVVRAIGSSPDDAGSLFYSTLISAIASAETSVHLTNAYFVPDPQLLAALEKAVARGVDVKIILPGKTDSWLVFNAGRSYYSGLLRRGVKLYERRVALLHSKTALIDGVWSSIGSSNLDRRSLLHNDEVNAVILGNEFGAQMEAMFVKDLGVSDAITAEAWGTRSLGTRVKEIAARLWGYWL